jgi:tetratricopeptide (TPR) repeat protein
MSVRLERARLLLAQSRPADAEREALAALAELPDNPAPHTLLALSRLALGRKAEALESARAALGLAPDSPHSHYILALILHRMERDDEADQAVAAAIRLDPADADNFSLRSSIQLARRDWNGALAAAEAALALDPENVGAANLRSMALVRLGRKAEAMATVDFALHRAPENAFSHANQGWNCLHRNDPRRAQEHFREALRLEPDLEYARQGMLEALKARNPVYRGMLAYFLWSGRLARRLQWALIAGVWFGGRLLRGLTETEPQLRWLWWSLLALFYGFVFLTWTAGPMFNLLLRFDRFGRHVLSRAQRRASNWFGAALAATLACFGWFLRSDNELVFLAAMLLAVLSLCIAASFDGSGAVRKKLALGTGGLALLGAAGIACFVGENDTVGGTLVTLFILGFVAFQLAANFLR